MNWNGTNLNGTTDLTIVQDFHQVQSNSNYTADADQKVTKIENEQKLMTEKESIDSYLKLDEHPYKDHK